MTKQEHLLRETQNLMGKHAIVLRLYEAATTTFPNQQARPH